VIVASCAPPIRLVQTIASFFSKLILLSYPNVYGIDMPSRKELVAYGRDSKAIASAIGADLVIFQSLPDLVDSVRQFNPTISNFDCSVFTGDYVTGGVTEEYLQHLEVLRSDNMRATSMSLDVGAQEEKGNGLKKTDADAIQSPSSPVMFKTDDTVGLHNSFNRQ